MHTSLDCRDASAVYGGRVRLVPQDISVSAFSNTLSAAHGLVSSAIELAEHGLPLINIAIIPDSQKRQVDFDLRVRYYLSTGAYLRALVFESTTSGINLDRCFERR